MNTFLSFLIPFVFVLIVTPFFRILAVRFGVLDLPGRRKIHKRATPLLGGIAIYFGLLSGLLFNGKYFSFFLPILAGATVIMLVSLIDDIKRNLSAQFRLFCQLAAALIVICSGIRVDFLPSTWWGNTGEIIITFIWILGVTNACNYLDGMDGLATGSAVVNLFCFAVILFNTSQYYIVMFSVGLMGACAGFLPYNFKKAKIFLGDAGSTLIGFTLACIALVGHWAADNIVKISIPILILGVPIFDMIFTTIMRIKEGKVKTIIEWLQYGGRDHFHHYLVDLGLSTMGAVIFIYFITFSLGISAIMLSNDSAPEAFMTLSQAAIIFGIIAALIVVGKKRRSGWSQ
jgi:UDP-GlcNAc:undecaprenyl-phosphate GlcNAc-1-phosphate transferase